MKSVSNADDYFSGLDKWKEELSLLREIVLSAGLEETIKWGSPVYMLNGKNLAAMAAFKSYAGLWFYQGVLLKDEAGRLINAQEGITKSLRQWRFYSLQEIENDRELIRVYVTEAMALSKRNLEIKPQRNASLSIPTALEEALEADERLKISFNALSLSKKRDFCEYIAGVRQDTTRQQRLARILPMILEGVGLNDKYKK